LLVAVLYCHDPHDVAVRFILILDEVTWLVGAVVGLDGLLSLQLWYVAGQETIHVLVVEQLCAPSHTTYMCLEQQSSPHTQITSHTQFYIMCVWQCKHDSCEPQAEGWGSHQAHMYLEPDNHLGVVDMKAHFKVGDVVDL
jgi:hypothetical protein